MGLRKFQCNKCAKTQLAFLGEEHRLSQADCGVEGCHVFTPLPPDPSVVHCTNVYMADAQLDSIRTIYELDKILTYEAREEKEIKILNDTRINM